MAHSVPDFLVVGAQKAASTTLLRALRDHPDVWMPASEDPFFRDPLFDEGRVAEHLATYDGHPEAAVGLKCPDYLARPEVPERLARHLERPRLITTLREPTSRAVSAYYWYVRWGMLPIEDPSAGLSALLRGDYRERVPSSEEILTWGLYGRALTRYLDWFDRDQLLVLFDHELRGAQLPAALRRTATFLGIDPAAVPADVERVSNEGVYEPRRLRFLQLRNPDVLYRHPDGDYWNVYPPSSPWRRARSAAVAGVDRYALKRLWGNDRPALDPAVLEQLRDYYREDLEVLSGIVGELPSGWIHDSPRTSGRG